MATPSPAALILTTGLSNSKLPVTPEDPRQIRTMYDFSAGGTIEYITTLQGPLSRGEMKSVQSIWIDNSANGANVTFTVPDSQQVIVAPPNSQGFYPLMFPGYEINVTCIGGDGICKIAFLNFPVQYIVWQGVGSIAGFRFNAQGELLVADPNIEAILLSVIDGGGSVVDVAGTMTVVPSGSAGFATIVDVTLPVTTTTLVLAANANIVEVTVSCTAAWRVGDASTGVARGVALAANQVYTFQTSGPVHGFSTPGGTVSCSYSTL